MTDRYAYVMPVPLALEHERAELDLLSLHAAQTWYERCVEAGGTPIGECDVTLLQPVRDPLTGDPLVFEYEDPLTGEAYEVPPMLHLHVIGEATLP